MKKLILNERFADSYESALRIVYKNFKSSFQEWSLLIKDNYSSQQSAKSYD